MRCTQCGLPLSPSRTTCPRCGTVNAGASNKARQTQDAAASQQGMFNHRSAQSDPFGQPGIELPQQSHSTFTPSATWDAPGKAGRDGGLEGQGKATEQQVPFPIGNAALTHDPGADMPTQPQQGQPLWLPSTPFPPVQPEQPAQPIADQATWPQQSQTPLSAPPPTPLPFLQAPYKNNDRTGGQTTRTGFTIASLCIITGGLILVFVYFMAQGLYLPGTAAQNNTSQGATVTPGHTPTAATATPTTEATPTPTYPGKLYIDNAQVASAVNTATGVPTKVTTTFAPGKTIYVTFSVHTGGHVGAACLFWYINNQQFSQYQFELTPTAAQVYSYASTGSTGPGYVEIYWASSTLCTDKALAQRTDFTVG